jgi:hypothetical protein
LTAGKKLSFKDFLTKELDLSEIQAQDILKRMEKDSLELARSFYRTEIELKNSIGREK